MLDYIREGDIVIVTELDRLGRNNKDLTEIMNAIQQKGATLEVLNLPSMNGIEDENLRQLINNLEVPYTILNVIVGQITFILLEWRNKENEKNWDIVRFYINNSNWRSLADLGNNSISKK